MSPYCNCKHDNVAATCKWCALEDMRKRSMLDPSAQRHYVCGCIGPQNGQPLCPCQMRGVQIKDGRYVRIQDLGPVP
jgi:hypothetical protein